MVAEIKYSCSIKGFIPSLGIQLIVLPRVASKSTNYYIKTGEKYFEYAECEYCGEVYIRRKTARNKLQKFCSRECAVKHRMKRLHESFLKIAYKNVDLKEFSIFFKKYKNFVYAEIWTLCPEYYEELRDWWNENAIRHFYNIRKFEIIRHRKVNRIKYLKKAVYFAFLNKKNTNREVFYDECSIATQKYILGEGNYE